MYKTKALEYFRKYVPKDMQQSCIQGFKRYLRQCHEQDRLPCDPFRFIKSQRGELWREFLRRPDEDVASARPAPRIERRGEGPPLPIREMVKQAAQKVQQGAAPC